MTICNLSIIIILMKNLFTLKTLGWVMTAIVVYMLGVSGFNKITQSNEMLASMTFLNLSSQMVWIGLIEVASIALLLIPRTSMFGALGVSLTMAGAVAVHFAVLGGAGVGLPIALGVLAWSGHCLRTYELKPII